MRVGSTQALGRVAANLLAALRQMLDAEQLADIEDVLREAAIRGIGPVRALAASGIPLDLIQRAAWVHRGFDLVAVSPSDVPAEALSLLPLHVCKARTMIPCRADADGIVVAVADPADLTASDQIRSALAGRGFRIVLADRHNIEQVISSLEARQQGEAVAIRGAPAASQQAPAAHDEASGDLAQLVRAIIVKAAASNASDIHFEPSADGLDIRHRIDGVLSHVVTHPKLIAAGLVNRIKVLAGLDLGERRQPQEGRFALSSPQGDLNLRVVVFPTVSDSEAAVVRILRDSAQAILLDDLGFSPWTLQAYRELCTGAQGLVLATGPTGAGKTTTLYAGLTEVATPDTKVLTVEEPVEIKLPMATQVQVNRKAGLTFAKALRSFLRADPDILLVGEIRDHETALTCIEASLTGHLVLASTHAGTAPLAVTRLIELGLDPHLVASALRGVVAQRLVRRLCMHCRVPEPVPPGVFEHLAHLEPMPERIWRASMSGCEECRGTGHRGRLPIAEVMSVDEKVAAAIAESRLGPSVADLAVAGGMVPLRDDGLVKVMRGLASHAEVRKA